MIATFNKLRHKNAERERRVKKAYATVEKQLERAKSKMAKDGGKKRKREAKKKKKKSKKRDSSSNSE